MGGEGIGDGFDPCETIWNHQIAMARLLNILRNSQTVCTDNECFEPGSAPPGRATSTENLYFMTFAIGIALLLFFLRPRPQVNEVVTKPINRHDSNDAPPSPPIN